MTWNGWDCSGKGNINMGVYPQISSSLLGGALSEIFLHLEHGENEDDSTLWKCAFVVKIWTGENNE